MNRPHPTTEGNTNTHTTIHTPLHSPHTRTQPTVRDSVSACTSHARRGIYWIVLTAVLGMPALIYFHGATGTVKPKPYTGLGKTQINGKKKKLKDEQPEEEE